MENTEKTTIETTENKPKRKVLLKRIEELELELKKANDTISSRDWSIRCRERDLDSARAEVAQLKAYIAGIKGDAFPESEDK